MKNLSKISNGARYSRGSTAMVVLIIVLVILAMAASGAAVYFWQKSRAYRQAGKSAAQSPATKIATPTTTPTATQPTTTKTPTPAQTTTTKPTPTPAQTPTEVVEIFMKSTLGTLPGAKVDYELAQSLMTDNLKAKYSGEGWVPLLYGIQDGPVSVKFISENVAGDYATVRFDPSWGEMSLGWAFTLKKVENKWLIDDFRNDVQ